MRKLLCLILHRLCAACKPVDNRPRLGLEVFLDGVTVKGEVHMLDIEVGQSQRLKATALDRRNNPSGFDLSDINIEWASTDTSIVDVVQDVNDPQYAVITVVGEGEAEITVRGDADRDPGEQRIIDGSFRIRARSPEAVLVSIETDGDAYDTPENPEP